ncbi:Endoglucanase [bioreactor metagenome]|uniref:Endoglucanase n=1 Tax=bioreactor metagenome TaxID=1076179 RepID=A0A645GB98_9ZZZZ
MYALLSGSGTIKVINNAKNFIDIKSSDWFYNSILFVNSRVIFIGVSEDEFGPKLPMTRAMLATALHRLENKVDSNAQVTYTDVLQEQWYSDSIAWVVEAGIVSGYGNGVFGTNDNINREQLATIMYNYAKYTGLSTVERGGIQHFSDAEQTSPWATDALRWAVGIGLMQGDGNNLNPKGDASRADVATIIMRFVEIMVK